VTFVLFVFVADLLEIPVERRMPVSLALAPAIAFGLLRVCPQEALASACRAPVSPQVGEVLFVFALGTISATAFRAIRGNDLRLPRLVKGAMVIMGLSAVYQAALSLAPTTLTFGPPKMSPFGLIAVLLVVIALDVGIESALDVVDESRPIARALRDQARATVPLLLSMVSVGALLAVAYPAFGVWTFPLFLAPLAATQFSFKQVVTIRKNYLQTIRALSRVPEMAGYTVQGHSLRVAELSIEIGSELGAGDTVLQEIEYAALLHDIGRISLPDPGDAARTTSALELALVGAEIVENTGHFPQVARMVRHQHEQYRRRGEDANSDLPLGAKVIKVASAYDDLTEPGGPGRTAWDALEKMHLGMAYEYDPQVIQALTRVLEKRALV